MIYVGYCFQFDIFIQSYDSYTDVDRLDVQCRCWRKVISILIAENLIS